MELNFKNLKERIMRNPKDSISNVCGLVAVGCTIVATGVNAEVMPKSWMKYSIFLAGSSGAIGLYLTGKPTGGPVSLPQIPSPSTVATKPSTPTDISGYK